ncbi:hypothetical protein FB45DRAFT_1009613 [Roridomyces roridus]|uniref:Uncharacterized protein n=1 Tax=Roridomyces roridus TaxID=1738132 RepID=A0AAD7B6S6_9AGAR|nr:hypothetical protein FB45DRAFT_1009613 [Roridomyces roridus]
MPDNSLPDEIFSEILSPAMKVPDEKFADFAVTSPSQEHSESSSAYLLVCKSWLRVGTPLLYDVVILWSKAQAKALAQALSKNKHFGQFIKHLRVEGGYGEPMRTILETAPNIIDLFLSFDISASDDVAGLCEGLAFIQPRRLLARDNSTRPAHHKTVEQLEDALVAVIPEWHRLSILQCPSMGGLQKLPHCCRSGSCGSSRHAAAVVKFAARCFVVSGITKNPELSLLRLFLNLIYEVGGFLLHESPIAAPCGQLNKKAAATFWKLRQIGNYRTAVRYPSGVTVYVSNKVAAVPEPLTASGHWDNAFCDCFDGAYAYRISCGSCAAPVSGQKGCTTRSRALAKVLCELLTTETPLELLPISNSMTIQIKAIVFRSIHGMIPEGVGSGVAFLGASSAGLRTRWAMVVVQHKEHVPNKVTQHECTNSTQFRAAV